MRDTIERIVRTRLRDHLGSRAARAPVRTQAAVQPPLRRRSGEWGYRGIGDLDLDILICMR
jgi:hypothetical protein